MVARRAHNPEVAGSSPASATNKSLQGGKRNGFKYANDETLRNSGSLFNRFNTAFNFQGTTEEHSENQSDRPHLHHQSRFYAGSWFHSN